MRPKRLLLLGGLRYLQPVIEAAHQQGYHVITADNVPGNYAHRLSDEYCNVSIVDREAVLAAARRLEVDGVMSFACDPGVVTASYVQTALGLPSFGPFESVDILQHKDRFRAFLRAHGFNTPWAYGFGSEEEAWQHRGDFSYPLIVKPTDSAGSKGCTRVNDEAHLRAALTYAMSHSLGHRLIVEQYLACREGTDASDTDCYVEDGQLRFVSFSSQLFDAHAPNPNTPAAYCWPSSFTADEEAQLTAEIQRLITLLGLRTSVLNVETRIATDGRPYIMELTPRGGGNRLSELLRMATGVDLITAITRATVGDAHTPVEQRPYSGYWAEIILHAQRDGIFAGLSIDERYASHIVEQNLWVRHGDEVKGFEGASNTLGTMVLRFDDEAEMREALRQRDRWLRVEVVQPHRAIGGYFGLETRPGQAFHAEAAALNTASNALLLLLRARRYSRVFVPSYICDSVLRPLQQSGTPYTFYAIDERLELASPLTLSEDEALLYVDYFGLKDAYIATLAQAYRHVIIDSSQAFYSQPERGRFGRCDVIYSCRKFFGVADGAYLVSDALPNDAAAVEELERDTSAGRMAHLLRRIDRSAQEGYADFQQTEEMLRQLPPRRMSRLTETILAGIDYDGVALSRRRNFAYLHHELRTTNRLTPVIDAAAKAVPMVYPLWTADGEGLRRHLIAHQVFCAQYWPNVLEWEANGTLQPRDLEPVLTRQLVALPIDQRYDTADMRYILSLIQQYESR